MRYLALALLIPFTACSAFSSDGGGVAASGSGTTRTFPVTGFDAVDLRGADDVAVHLGKTFSVTAQGPSEALDTLRIDRKRNTLQIDRRDSGSGTWDHDAKIKIFVTLPRLAAASVTGSGDMTVDRVVGSELRAAVAGSGSLDLRDVRIETLEAKIAGSGDLRAAGTANTLSLSVAGSGSVAAKRLTARTASVSIAGSGNVEAMVDGDASVSMMGSGNVDLGGRAKCTVEKMGSGSVRCGSGGSD